MDLELELISDKAEKYGGHSVALARVSVVALSSQPVDHDKRLINDPNERLCQEYSDEEEEFSSEAEAEGSDSEPTLEVHRRKSRGKIPTNARVRKTFLLSSIEIYSTSLPLYLFIRVLVRPSVRPSTLNLESRISKNDRKILNYPLFYVSCILQQRNLKQKFIALLKRFRVSEDLDHDQEEIGQKLSGI